MSEKASPFYLNTKDNALEYLYPLGDSLDESGRAEPLIVGKPQMNYLDFL